MDKIWHKGMSNARDDFDRGQRFVKMGDATSDRGKSDRGKALIERGIAAATKLVERLEAEG